MEMEYARLDVIIRTVRFKAEKLIVMGAVCAKTGNQMALRASGSEWSEPFEIGTTWAVTGYKSEQLITWSNGQCSGQLIPDSILRFSSAAMGEMPSLNV